MLLLLIFNNKTHIHERRKQFIEQLNKLPISIANQFVRIYMVATNYKQIYLYL